MAYLGYHYLSNQKVLIMKCVKFTLACLLLTTSAVAQPPRGNQGGGRGPGRGNNNEAPISRLMELDKDQDGNLAEDEITDRRLRSLFERADGDKDKIVTKEELQSLIEKEPKNQNNGARMGRGGPGGPGNFGGGPGPGRPGGPEGFGGGPGGPGGPGGFGGGPGGQMRPPMPKPGTVLPEFLINELRLSTEQSDELAKLQTMVDERLASILTKDQQDQLKHMEGGPGRPGGMGPGGMGPGPGGFGPGGPGGREGAPNDNQPRRPARE